MEQRGEILGSLALGKEGNVVNLTPDETKRLDNIFDHLFALFSQAGAGNFSSLSSEPQLQQILQEGYRQYQNSDKLALAAIFHFYKMQTAQASTQAARPGEKSPQQVMETNYQQAASCLAVRRKDEQTGKINYLRYFDPAGGEDFQTLVTQRAEVLCQQNGEDWNNLSQAKRCLYHLRAEKALQQEGWNDYFPFRAEPWKETPPQPNELQGASDLCWEIWQRIAKEIAAGTFQGQADPFTLTSLFLAGNLNLSSRMAPEILAGALRRARPFIENWQTTDAEGFTDFLKTHSISNLPLLVERLHLHGEQPFVEEFIQVTKGADLPPDYLTNLENRISQGVSPLQIFNEIQSSYPHLVNQLFTGLLTRARGFDPFDAGAVAKHTGLDRKKLTSVLGQSLIFREKKPPVNPKEKLFTLVYFALLFSQLIQGVSEETLAAESRGGH